MVGQHHARGRRGADHDRPRPRGPARQSRQHDLPGTRNRLRSRLHHRPADLRDRAPPHRQEPGRRAEARQGAARDGAHPVAGDAPQRLSTRNVGRHAPARHDRARAVLQSEPPAGRRANDRARCDGADPGPAADPGAPARTRSRRDLRHPRYRCRGRSLRPGRGDVCGQARRARERRTDGRRAQASLQPRPAGLDGA